MLDHLQHAVHDKIRFLHSFLRSPRSVGSIMPSSEFLAREMLKRVPWQEASVIVELGAGTGVFTRHIDALKAPHAQVVVYEQDRWLREDLRVKYPGLAYRSNAISLEKDLRELGFGQADVIISGLPFANFPPKIRDEILESIYRALRTGGIFVMFQYSPQMLNRLKRRFERVALSFVLPNLPPAIVYTCRK
jgi:phospholipid N-methyltransferase